MTENSYDPALAGAGKKEITSIYTSPSAILKFSQPKRSPYRKGVRVNVVVRCPVCKRLFAGGGSFSDHLPCSGGQV